MQLLQGVEAEAGPVQIITAAPRMVARIVNQQMEVMVAEVL